MLPDDAKARKSDLQQKLQQTQVNDHFDEVKPEDKPEPYSDEIFKEAMIQWLVETDQVCTACMIYVFFLLILLVCLADSSHGAPIFQKNDVNCGSCYAWSEDSQPQTDTKRNHSFIQETYECSTRAIKCKLISFS